MVLTAKLKTKRLRDEHVRAVTGPQTFQIVHRECINAGVFGQAANVIALNSPNKEHIDVYH